MAKCLIINLDKEGLWQLYEDYRQQGTLSDFYTLIQEKSEEVTEPAGPFTPAMDALQKHIAELAKEEILEELAELHDHINRFTDPSRIKPLPALIYKDLSDKNNFLPGLIYKDMPVVNLANLFYVRKTTNYDHKIVREAEGSFAVLLLQRLLPDRIIEKTRQFLREKQNSEYAAKTLDRLQEWIQKVKTESLEPSSKFYIEELQSIIDRDL